MYHNLAPPKKGLTMCTHSLSDAHSLSCTAKRKKENQASQHEQRTTPISGFTSERMEALNSPKGVDLTASRCRSRTTCTATHQHTHQHTNTRAHRDKIFCFVEDSRTAPFFFNWVRADGK